MRASARPNVARRRAKGAQRWKADDSDESLLSEETSAENAWPRSQTADDGHGNGLEVAEELL